MHNPDNSSAEFDQAASALPIAPKATKVPKKKAVKAEPVAETAPEQPTAEEAPAVHTPPVEVAEQISHEIVVYAATPEQLLTCNSLHEAFSIKDYGYLNASAHTKEEAIARTKAIYKEIWIGARYFLTTVNTLTQIDMLLMGRALIKYVSERYDVYAAGRNKAFLESRTLENIVQAAFKGQLAEHFVKKLFRMLPGSDEYVGSRPFDMQLELNVPGTLKHYYRIEVKYRDLSKLNEEWPRIFTKYNLPNEENWDNNKWSESDDLKGYWEPERKNTKLYDFDMLITVTVQRGRLMLHGGVSGQTFRTASILGRRRINNKKPELTEYVKGQRDVCVHNAQYNRDFDYLRVADDIELRLYIADYRCDPEPEDTED